jgi:poly [ADP-ribose] polymerase
LPPGKNSTKGVGKTFPPEDSYMDLEGVQVPLGVGKKNETIRTSLLYNEYIVYRIEQIKLKYLLRVKFNYKK